MVRFRDKIRVRFSVRVEFCLGSWVWLGLVLEIGTG